MKNAAESDEAQQKGTGHNEATGIVCIIYCSRHAEKKKRI